MKKISMVVVVGWIGLCAQAEFVTDLSKGWRMTVGPQFHFNASGRLGVKGSAVALPASMSVGNKANARAAGDAETLGSGKTTFANGAFINSDDAAGVSGESWNWHIPAGQLNGGTMSIVHPYAERSTTYMAVGGSDRDENWSVGTSFGVERAFYKQGDFGVDLGFNFAFFIKDNWFKGSAPGFTRTDSTTQGSYVTDVNMGNVDILNDPWTQNADGSYGAGTFDGPGPVINLNDISISHHWGAESSSSSTMTSRTLSIRGDLQMYEFQLALKPYYELTDWFMLRGTIGLGLDYRNFDVKVDGRGKGSSDDWDCYMLCGLGCLFHHENICLGADFLRKVFNDNLDVNTRYVEGSISDANWMFRLYVGYEF